MTQDTALTISHNQNEGAVCEIDETIKQLCLKDKGMSRMSILIPDDNQLESIDLSGNKLEFFDMNQLLNIRNLRYLNLSNNLLKEIDLSPLSRVRTLEVLDLSDNNLVHLNLFPLVRCTKLKQLSISSNHFASLNLTPLILCRNLDRFTTSNILYFQKYLDDENRFESFSELLIESLVKNAWLYRKPSWIINQGGSIKPEFSFTDNSPSYNLENSFRRKIARVVKRYPILSWFKLQIRLFKELNMGELIGLDSPFADILMDIPDLLDHEDGREEFYRRIVLKIQNQLLNKGSTHFFDVKDLSTTRGSVLVPLILERRKEEIKELRLSSYKEQVDLMPLWYTSYGFEVLRNLNLGRLVGIKEFQKIEGTFKKLKLDLHIEASDSFSNSFSDIQMSDELKELIATEVQLNPLAT